MSLFEQAAAVASLQSRSAQALQTYLPGWTPDPDILWGKIKAAEKDLAGRLRILLEPTEVFPYPPSADEIAALSGTPWIEEPANDLTREFFSGDSWGYLVTRQRPIVSVHSIRFVYPSPLASSWDVPAEWIRVDKKYGHIRIVPGGGIVAIPMAAWIMPAMTAGRTIPQMIQVRYRAGLENAAENYPEIIDLVYKMATLATIQDAMPAASFSQSIDGMSQTVSADIGKLGDFIDGKIETLRQRLHGIRMTVL